MNTETIRTLLWADTLSAKRWFATMTVARAVVALLFLLLFVGVAVGIGAVSDVFFRSLLTFEQYGRMTADYIVHASVVIVLWLAVGSCIASFAGLLTSPDSSLVYILSLPVPTSRISLWLYGKALVANLLLMVFAFVPIAVGYGRAFDVLSLWFVMRTILVLTCIVAVASGLGLIAALAVVAWVRGREYPATIVGLVFFLAVMVGMLKLIFPPTLSRLYDAPAPTFMTLFQSLPLNNPLLPTMWLSRIVTEGIRVQSVFALGTVAAIVLVCLGVGARRFAASYLRANSGAFAGNLSMQTQRMMARVGFPLLYKDLLSIVRVPSEAGYGMFLFSVAVFFFLFLSLAAGGELRQEAWRANLVIFSFSWLLFFTTALFLRFLFPLVAREGKSPWYLFALPVSRRNAIESKVLLGIVMALPCMVVASAIWYGLPFAGGFRDILIAVSMMTILLLALVHVLLGAIVPNFSQGNDPEKVSTSGMGFATLAVSTALTVGVALGIGSVVGGQWSQLGVVGALGAGGTLLVAVLALGAVRFSRNYQW